MHRDGEGARARRVVLYVLGGKDVREAQSSRAPPASTIIGESGVLH